MRTGKEIYAEKIIADAKQDRMSRRKSGEDEANVAILDVTRFYYRKPVTRSGAFSDVEILRKPRLSCCVCRTQGGEFYIDDGKAFCVRHKRLMELKGEEKEVEISKERSKC